MVSHWFYNDLLYNFWVEKIEEFLGGAYLRPKFYLIGNLRPNQKGKKQVTAYLRPSIQFL